MKDLSPEEAGRWMEATPPLVQAAVMSPATGQVIEQIGKQYALHIDVVGLLMKLTSYMLVGYVTPEDFLKEVLSVGITDQQAKQIIYELNKKIFVPLREEMRKGPPRPTAQMAGNEPLPLRPAVAPSVGGPQSEKHFQLQNKIPPRPLNNPPSGLSGDRSVKQNDLAAAPSQRPDLRNVLAAVTKSPNLLNGEKLLEDHEEPHIEFRKSVPPPNLPGAPRPSEAFGEGGIPPPVSAPLKPSTLPIASVPPVPAKPYSSDPYREPVDEK